MQTVSKVGFILSLLMSLAACATNDGATSNADKPLVESEYKLQEDRKAFEELRSEVPQNIQDENDEVAFMEKLFTNPLKKPSDIRAQFSKALNKKREKFRKDMQKKREKFVKEERKARESMTKSFERERNEFNKTKTTREETKEFYASLDQRRKDFYSQQREQRDEFEAQMRDDRRNFEDYAREKQNDFNARLKEFTEKQKEIKDQKN